MEGSLTFKPKEAAKAANVCLPVMYEWCRRSDFPAIRIGRSIIIPKDLFVQWLENQASGQR